MKQYSFGYQGQFAEDETDETGYNSFEARLYDAKIGRWTTIDPAGQFFSPYLGMGNNPVNGVDPDGESYWEINKNGTISLLEPTNDKYHVFYNESGKYQFAFGNLDCQFYEDIRGVSMDNDFEMSFDFGGLYKMGRRQVDAAALLYPKNYTELIRMYNESIDYGFQYNFDIGLDNIEKMSKLSSNYFKSKALGDAATSIFKGKTPTSAVYKLYKELYNDLVKPNIKELPKVPDHILNEGIDEINKEYGK